MDAVSVLMVNLFKQMIFCPFTIKQNTIVLYKYDRICSDLIYLNKFINKNINCHLAPVKVFYPKLEATLKHTFQRYSQTKPLEK